MITGAKTLCEIYPDTDCEILTFNKEAQAKYGIYDSYLHVAKTAMNKNMPALARKYLDLAHKFQHLNKTLILSCNVVEQLLDELAWKFFENAKQFYDIGNYAEALEAYANALEIYDIIDVNTYNDLIEKQMKNCIIKN